MKELALITENLNNLATTLGKHKPSKRECLLLGFFIFVVGIMKSDEPDFQYTAMVDDELIESPSYTSETTA